MSHSRFADQLAQIDEVIASLNSKSQKTQTDLLSFDGKLKQLSVDLQTKTNDLFDELQETQSKVEELQSSSTAFPPPSPRSPEKKETSPERPSRAEALVSLRASIEYQME